MATKAEFHGRIWGKLLAFERAERLLREGDRVIAAVSGGPDSVCLADFLARVAKRRRLALRLAHFDHGLRRSAAADARLVEKLGRELGVAVHVERLAVRAAAKSRRGGLEDAGRSLRYAALARLAQRTRSNKVATGHQLDDQAETVLLHLLRGTKPRGLAGVAPKRPLAARVQVVRPLLCLTRAEVLEYLRYRGLKWREDPTNRSREFLRNWVRLDLLPMIERKAPGVKERLSLLAAAARNSA